MIKISGRRQQKDRMKKIEEMRRDIEMRAEPFGLLIERALMRLKLAAIAPDHVSSGRKMLPGRGEHRSNRVMK